MPSLKVRLKNIGVTATPEQIQNKLNALATFNVTGNEAKRNVMRSLAKDAGVDPVAAFKAGSTPVHISEIKEDGKSYASKTSSSREIALEA